MTGSIIKWTFAHLILLVFVVASEMAYRHLLLPIPYLVHKPGTYLVDRSVYGVGLSGNVVFTADQLGLRSSSEGARSAPDLLVQGASGTMGLLLDDAESWPLVLEKRFHGSGKKIRVANAARPGNGMRENRFQLERFLEQGIKPKKVLVVASGIDLLIDIYRSSPLGQFGDSELVSRAFSHSFSGWGVKNWALLQMPLNPKAQGFQPPEVFFQKATENRRNGRKVDEPVSLQLTEKRLFSEMQRIVQLAQEKRFSVSFITRPTLWKEGNSKEEEKLFWLGQKGTKASQDRPDPMRPSDYYSSQILARSMNDYNRFVLQNCATLNVSCLNLAEQVPKSTNHFFDDSHLTPLGSELAAEIIFRWLSGQENGAL